MSASTAVGALLAYTKDSYRLALNVTNIADTRYVAACYGYTSCFYAEGREAIAKLTYRWWAASTLRRTFDNLATQEHGRGP